MSKGNMEELLTKILGDNFKRMFFEWGKTVANNNGWVNFKDLSDIEEFSKQVATEEELLSGAVACDNIEVDAEKKCIRLKSASAGNLVFVEVTGVPKEATVEEIKNFFAAYGTISDVSRSQDTINRNKAILSMDVEGGTALIAKRNLSYGETECPLTNRFLPRIYLKQVKSAAFEKQTHVGYVKPEKYLKPGLTLKVTGENLQEKVPIATLSHLFGQKYSSIGQGVRFSAFEDSQTAYILFRTKDLAEHSMYSFIAHPTPARGVTLSVSIATDREQERIKQKAFDHEQQRVASKTSKGSRREADKRAKMESKLTECVEAGDFEFA
eukprot:TRINITY_DN18429_c0_g1_i2.p1 TRINITY_DN18429_c0_g1~~TRINITY_DN18429_c0_g1_i2.p1  ORF type:complete len:349 (+),score=63.98 TRINITY_DN18429_c0_g1_i2:74-1048(+)